MGQSDREKQRTHRAQETIESSQLKNSKIMMKTLLTFVFLLLGWQSFAQQTDTNTITPSLKYGKPSEEELNMTAYAGHSRHSRSALFKEYRPLRPD